MKHAPLQPLRSAFANSYDAFHKHLPVASFWMDTERRIQGCNDKLLELVGCSDPGPLANAREEDLIATDAWETLAELDRIALQSGAPQCEHDLHAYLPDGREAYLETSRIPLSSPGGKSAGILVTYSDVTERHHARLRDEEQQATLAERNRTIEFDLDSAQQIQKFLMGRQAESCPYLDVAFRYQYMEKVGGDYLCFRSLEGGSYSLLLADLTGHGVTAALFMALLKYISQETPEEVRVLPGYFLNYLDMEFYEQIPNGFFTAFAATAHYRAERQAVEIEYSNASHPAAIVVRKDGSHQLLETGHFAIGLLDLVERKSHSIELQLGDRLYAYTDGFLESIDPDGNEFGLDAFCQVLASHRHLSLEESIQRAYDALSAFTQSGEPQDDMTLLAIEAKAKTEPEPSPKDEDEDPWGFN